MFLHPYSYLVQVEYNHKQHHINHTGVLHVCRSVNTHTLRQPILFWWYPSPKSKHKLSVKNPLRFATRNTLQSLTINLLKVSKALLFQSLAFLVGYILTNQIKFTKQLFTSVDIVESESFRNQKYTRTRNPSGWSWCVFHLPSLLNICGHKLPWSCSAYDIYSSSLPPTHL